MSEKNSKPSLETILFDARQRNRLLMETWLPVSVVAKDWGVTPRRVRALLETLRLGGRRQENGYWEVCYPYSVTEGRRGPLPRRQAARKSVLRAV
jgi:hypothetical protein